MSVSLFKAGSLGNDKPFVSCICPTYDRRKFLPYLIYMFNKQTYPADKLELIILDDSSSSNKDIIDANNVNNNIKYIYSKDRICLGKKRNFLNKMAKGEFIVCLDDDDYYPPDKVSYTLKRMIGSKSRISGSSEMYFFFTEDKKVHRFNSLNPHHATNGTFVYHRDFLKNHVYEDTANMSEEKFFLNNYDEPILQIDPHKAILCICHKKNTFDKNKIRKNLPFVGLKLNQLIKDPYLLDFYMNLNKS
jgi:glycosyltransferase involved in cell wall biosynthesis